MWLFRRWCRSGFFVKSESSITSTRLHIVEKIGSDLSQEIMLFEEICHQLSFSACGNYLRQSPDSEEDMTRSMTAETHRKKSFEISRFEAIIIDIVTVCYKAS